MTTGNRVVARIVVLTWLALTASCAGVAPASAPAARQEGKVVLASGPTAATRQNLPRAFKERFGVDLEYLGGRTNDLVNRLQNERAAGLYTVDVIITGG